MNPEELRVSHLQAKEEAVTLFQSIKKMGGNIMSEKFELLLDEELDKLYSEFCKTNDNKNIFMAARTPAVFVTIIVICYLSSGVVGLISGFLANLILILMCVALLLLTVWAVSRYTGQYRDLSTMIDSLATFIFEEVSNHSFLVPIGPLTAHQFIDPLWKRYVMCEPLLEYL